MHPVHGLQCVRLHMRCTARRAGDFHQLPPVAKGPAALAGITKADQYQGGSMSPLNKSLNFAQGVGLHCSPLIWYTKRHLIGILYGGGYQYMKQIEQLQRGGLPLRRPAGPPASASACSSPKCSVRYCPEAYGLVCQDALQRPACQASSVIDHLLHRYSITSPGAHCHA